MTDLRTELLRIRTVHGRLNDELLVAEATPEDSPLHDRFEWDDTIAGHQYRLVQAGEILRAVRIVDRSNPRQPHHMRAFLAVPRADTRKHDYVPIEEVAEDEVASATVLAEMEREWRSMKQRYGHIKAFIELVRKDLAA